MSKDREIAINLMTTAAKAVGKQRGPQHGATEPSFRMIAEFWSTHINHILEARTGVQQIPIHLTAWDVAQMMGQLKIARSVYGDPTLGDHYADAIGYIGLAGGLASASTGEAEALAKVAIEAVKAAVQDPHAVVPVDQVPVPTGGGTPPEVAIAAAEAVDPIPSFMTKRGRHA